MNYENSLDFARKLDQEDPLRAYRTRFYIPEHNGKPIIYFCGNSLGLQPKAAKAVLEHDLSVWQQMGVEGWFAVNPLHDEAWIGYHRACKEPLAKVVGAMPAEVCPMNSLTVNLHLLLSTFYQPTAGKPKILTIAGDFPSDQYALETHIKSRGFDPDEVLIEIRPEADGLIRLEAIQDGIAAHAGTLALVLMSGLNYYTGQVYDMKAIAQTAREHGITVGFDLAHAIGNVPVYLHDWGVDFATWCSYKYLNSGPGGISGIFVHEKHHAAGLPRLAGWWGYDEPRRFEMTKGFVPMPGADGWQVSTPNIPAMSLHKTALDITAEAGMEKLRQKSGQLTGYLYYLLREAGIHVLTPDDPAQRGAQLSLLVPDGGKALFNRLVEAGIIGDWREPDCIRLAPAPLYNTFEEVWRVADVISRF
ncbi:kynureninase [Arsenicibacter rosenii]|uniref:Kynureninase n=1 Tax=Arsenicibacter rosenii TaxID=1750698 RepID=A0A1S2VP85_9BACT|nr:kynureninase [Arsenicibacter rosenii]OIN60579.1 kynureninase [Arsenicibacter rosenii]